MSVYSGIDSTSIYSLNFTTIKMEYKDKSVLALFKKRDGLATLVLLKDENTFIVLNIAYGYDLGDEFAHITTNISPSIEGESIGFFFTSSIAKIIDPENKEVLFEALENQE